MRRGGLAFREVLKKPIGGGRLYPEGRFHTNPLVGINPPLPPLDRGVGGVAFTLSRE